MNANLLENSQLDTYYGPDSISDKSCVICLDPLYTPNLQIVSPSNDSFSDGESCDSPEFIDIELSTGNNSRQNDTADVWTCVNCSVEFHSNCIDQWKKNKVKFVCPICRHLYMLESEVIDITLSRSIWIRDKCINCIKCSVLGIMFVMFAIFVVVFIPYIQKFRH